MAEHDDHGVVPQHRAFYGGPKTAQDTERIVSPGNDHLVQLCRGGWLGADLRTGDGAPALDLGCGSGFNCVSLGMLGFAVHGVEIDPVIVDHARSNTADYGLDAQIEVGTAQAIPFPDDSMEFVVCMNVIHYAGSAEPVEQAIAEIGRVLRPGGTLYLTTNHPENWVLHDAEVVDDRIRRVRMPGDYRDGLEMYVWPDAAALRVSFDGILDDIRTGENRFDFFDRVVRNLTITGRRRDT